MNDDIELARRARSVRASVACPCRQPCGVLSCACGVAVWAVCSRAVRVRCAFACGLASSDAAIPVHWVMCTVALACGVARRVGRSYMSMWRTEGVCDGARFRQHDTLLLAPRPTRPRTTPHKPHTQTNDTRTSAPHHISLRPDRRDGTSTSASASGSEWRPQT